MPRAISQRSKLVKFVTSIVGKDGDIEFVLGTMDIGIGDVLGEFEEDTTGIYTVEDYKVSMLHDRLNDKSYAVIMIICIE